MTGFLLAALTLFFIALGLKERRRLAAVLDPEARKPR